MTEVIKAIYENGVLRPLEPLKLRERQTVCLQVVEEDQNDVEETLRIFVESGLMHPMPKGPIPPEPLSLEERRALAVRLGNVPGKTASEMVIEDRGKW